MRKEAGGSLKLRCEVVGASPATFWRHFKLIYALFYELYSRFRITKELRTVRKEAGGSLKLRCEVVGGPPATSWRWFKNDAPVIIEKEIALLMNTCLEVFDSSKGKCILI